MAGENKISPVNHTKVRLGFVSLGLAALCLAGSLMFFLAKGSIVLGIDVGFNKDLWGWTLMLVSVFLSMIGLTAAIMMKKR